MDERSLRELAQRSAKDVVQDLLGPNAHSKAQRAMDLAVAKHVEQMTRDGKIFRLTEEEVRMVRSFRKFKALIKRDGDVFKWQTRRPDPRLPSDTSSDETGTNPDPETTAVGETES